VAGLRSHRRHPRPRAWGQITLGGGGGGGQADRQCGERGLRVPRPLFRSRGPPRASPPGLSRLPRWARRPQLGRSAPRHVLSGSLPRGQTVLGPRLCHSPGRGPLLCASSRRLRALCGDTGCDQDPGPEPAQPRPPPPEKFAAPEGRRRGGAGGTRGPRGGRTAGAEAREGRAAGEGGRAGEARIGSGRGSLGLRLGAGRGEAGWGPGLTWSGPGRVPGGHLESRRPAFCKGEQTGQSPPRVTKADPLALPPPNLTAAANGDPPGGPREAGTFGDGSRVSIARMSLSSSALSLASSFSSRTWGWGKT
jgi:hypothetical protein